MKIVMTLLVRDEEDILETNLDYHLAQGVGFFIIMDHLSADRTPEILAEYERAGVAEITNQQDPGYRQGEWVTAMARRAATRYGADWVINSDADEFWWPVEGTLQTALDAIPRDCGVLSVSRHNFRPVADERGLFLERMTFRDTFSTNSLGEPLPPKACHRGHPEVVVAQGNHAATGEGLGDAREQEGITILHYPMRTYEQFERKISNGGRAYKAAEDLPPRLGWTWRSLYELYEHGGLPEFYRRSTLSEEAILRELSEGSIVEDRRLLTFLDKHEVSRQRRQKVNMHGESIRGPDGTDGGTIARAEDDLSHSADVEWDESR